jgi:hypothetical protein
LSIKNNHGKTAHDVAKTEELSSNITNYASTLKKTCPSATIQDKLRLVLIKENKQQKSEISNLQETMKSNTAALSKQHKIEMAAIEEKIADMHVN